MGDWAWIRGNIDSDLDGGFLLDKALEVNSAGSGSVTVTVPFNANGSLVWYSPIGDPESPHWRAGTATLRLSISSGNANVMITAASIERITQAGAFIESYGSVSISIAASTGTKTISIPVSALASAGPTDRVRLGFTLTHNGAIGSTNVGIGYGDAASALIELPITKTLRRYKAGSIGDGDEITAAPASISLRASVASLGMSAVPTAYNPPKSTSTSGGPSAEGS